MNNVVIVLIAYITMERMRSCRWLWPEVWTSSSFVSACWHSWAYLCFSFPIVRKEHPLVQPSHLDFDRHPSQKMIGVSPLSHRNNQLHNHTVQNHFFVLRVSRNRNPKQNKFLKTYFKKSETGFIDTRKSNESNAPRVFLQSNYSYIICAVLTFIYA